MWFHRARFVAGCVWDLKESLRKMGSDLVVRIGLGREVVAAMLHQIGTRDADGSERVDGERPRQRGDERGAGRGTLSRLSRRGQLNSGSSRTRVMSAHP